MDVNIKDKVAYTIAVISEFAAYCHRKGGALT